MVDRNTPLTAMFRWLLRATGVALVLLLAAAAALKLVYGGGAEFPDRSTEPALPAAALEVVATLDTPPGNIAVSATGRVFLTLHPEARPDVSVIEWVDGQARPWPSASFQHPKGDADGFRNVLAIRIDRQGRLWALDNGHHGLHHPALYGFDLASGNLVHRYRFPSELAPLGSHLNDFQVSLDGQRIYIADASLFRKDPAIVVYDIEQQHARRVISDHESVVAERYLPQVQGRRMEAFGLVAIRPGVDSIALSRDGRWLYFAPITNNHLYRVATRYLDDPALDPATVASRVERYALKTMSDGITTDDAGNVYLSDPEHSAIIELDPERELTTLIRDERLRWPDGFSFGPDGWLYVTGAALHQVIARPAESIPANAPYPVYRFKPGPTAAAGH